ncbi:crossover junction endodeoxyribonuclease RuvC [Mucilaginibacter rubeus]|uniref:Crossover junction endodeoxyribonuclease RuvC n=1 Tax=Mucilaginibacter rubeus TaxID=2027860 RepID=A0AAE6MKA8_9SPHI|nr:MULTISPECIES: crossover junction endodeoxyribonuclease RuvC [Mucilaginibacter]QEM06530.1 crossover junction endodeoxyribonuclease RuvC [Mucilaginibacter rubeus]QEM19119.1 crossover junction endodeoxyribonuclease RuvC [Mucilaginibacter gossypii]QTE44340.1 crossover junction endodeoxyribonuclease RuvC [Mucilaginibacter rubeus]QTE50940.1 crossover junction endodeoxyribonuclease RuvC [Mucilaginibacter rubeus]QTE56023.1 crossover junction endodeoxyribonuclease RuvC [Mucilaginibacter rubeus]
MQQAINLKERIILGIDPGTAVMGYGLLKETGPKIELLAMGVVKMPVTDDHMLKLQRIFEKTVALIDNYHPDCLAIEAPFYGKNIQVMLKLGRAQGMAIAAALSRNVDITEYAPRKIKQSITGNGNATKEQVAAMLQSLLKFKETPDFLDATDGLAVAVCHSFQRLPTSSGSGKSGSKKSYSGWDTFVKDNAKRIVK